MTASDRIAALEERLQHLEDRAAIEGLLYEYTAVMDGQELERLPSLFTDEVVMAHPRGRTAGRDEVVRVLRTAVGAHFTSHHMITNQRIVVSGDRARVVAYFHSVHVDDPMQPGEHDDHGGWYLLELVRSGSAGWRIHELRQVSVWSAGNRQPNGPLDPSMLPELRTHLRTGKRPSEP